MGEVDFTALHADPGPETVPRCPECRSKLRPHVLWFDELYSEHESYQIDRVLSQARKSRLVVFIGTSFSVGVTDLITDIALQRRAQVFSIDPGGTSPWPSIRVITERAEVLLPRLIASLE